MCERSWYGNKKRRGRGLGEELICSSSKTESPHSWVMNESICTRNSCITVIYIFLSSPTPSQTFDGHLDSYTYEGTAIWKKGGSGRFTPSQSKIIFHYSKEGCFWVRVTVVMLQPFGELIIWGESYKGGELILNRGKLMWVQLLHIIDSGG